jgi:hypothetical protein
MPPSATIGAEIPHKKLRYVMVILPDIGFHVYVEIRYFHFI